MASPGCRRWQHKGRTSTNPALNRYGRSRSALYRAVMAMKTLPNRSPGIPRAGGPPLPYHTPVFRAFNIRTVRSPRSAQAPRLQNLSARIVKKRGGEPGSIRQDRERGGT